MWLVMSLYSKASNQRTNRGERWSVETDCPVIRVTVYHTVRTVQYCSIYNNYNTIIVIKCKCSNLEINNLPFK